jgi:hypothetical protein
MSLPEADILYCDETTVVILCPYCDMVHKHGTGLHASIEGHTRSSHCHKGEYKFGNVITGTEIKLSIKNRKYDIMTKREYRLKQKKNQTPPQSDA